MMWKSLGFYEKGEQNMRYDFTKIIDRHGKDAIAVDGLGKNPGFAPEPPKDGFDVIRDAALPSKSQGSSA